MVNASSLATEEVREQRGQVGSKSHTNRVYKKKVNVLSNDAINKVMSLLDKPADEPGLSKVASIETIKGQGYILTPNRYIEMKKETVQHSSLEKLAEQLNRVSAEKGAVKLTINKKMASDLGLMPLIKLLQEGAQTSKELNEQFKDDGIALSDESVKLTINKKMASDLGLMPLIKLLQEGAQTSKELNEQFKDDGIALSDESIVTLTNSKTFKIEVKKWDKLPAIVVMFAQMWKQLMINCNNEENRYLMELKDIMLERYFG